MLHTHTHTHTHYIYKHTHSLSLSLTHTGPWTKATLYDTHTHTRTHTQTHTHTHNVHTQYTHRHSLSVSPALLHTHRPIDKSDVTDPFAGHDGLGGTPGVCDCVFVNVCVCCVENVCAPFVSCSRAPLTVEKCEMFNFVHPQKGETKNLQNTAADEPSAADSIQKIQENIKNLGPLALPPSIASPGTNSEIMKIIKILKIMKIPI